jgi:hypothetical protein
MRKIILSAVVVSCTFFFAAWKSDKDPLHKRKFTAKAQVFDVRDGSAKGKPVDDEIEFKNGKVYSLACWDKMEFQDVPYEIKKDSTFQDGDEEKHYIEVEAKGENDKKETLTMSFTVNGYDIEGTYKLTKKDLLKKSLTTTGTEKVKAKKGK